jgi:hypothetical protein
LPTIFIIRELPAPDHDTSCSSTFVSARVFCLFSFTCENMEVTDRCRRVADSTRPNLHPGRHALDHGDVAELPVGGGRSWKVQPAGTVILKFSAVNSFVCSRRRARGEGRRASPRRRAGARGARRTARGDGASGESYASGACEPGANGGFYRNGG